MTYGDLVTVSLQGDFGKPRPALVIQSNQFDNHSSVTVLLLTSALLDAPLWRVSIQPTTQNGLQVMSQIMIDKCMTMRRDKVGVAFGSVDPETMQHIKRLLAVFLNIA